MQTTQGTTRLRSGVCFVYSFVFLDGLIFFNSDTVGSCSMLPREHQGVVDPKLKVRISFQVLIRSPKSSLTYNPSFVRYTAQRTCVLPIYPSYLFILLHIHKRRHTLLARKVNWFAIWSSASYSYEPLDLLAADLIKADLKLK